MNGYVINNEPRYVTTHIEYFLFSYGYHLNWWWWVFKNTDLLQISARYPETKNAENKQWEIEIQN